MLYVSGTQDQANLHVQAIASLFESIGIDRLVSKYGNSKGWRQDRVRTSNGFNVQAYGLDAASRGVKIDKYRPDLIVLDDIDSQHDSADIVQKKIDAITSAIIPTGSADCAVLFLQNLIHEDGVVSQLVDGRAMFLLDREVPQVEPAIRDLVTELVDRGDGQQIYRIVSGEPTWAGQNLDTCAKQINDWGLVAFLREAQHEVQSTDGYFFDHTKFQIVEEIPSLVRVCLAWDLAATEGGGDYTVAVLMGIAENGVIYVLQVVRKQWSSDKVRAKVVEFSQQVKEKFAQYRIHLPQDPGQAGKDQADQYRRLLAQVNTVIEPVSGKKAVRARGWADKVNTGNVRLLKGDWNADFIREHRKFREDETHDRDDQVDAASDAFNEIDPPMTVKTHSRIKSTARYGRKDEDDD